MEETLHALMKVIGYLQPLAVLPRRKQNQASLGGSNCRFLHGGEKEISGSVV
jgi:hypothetical protein